MTDIQPPPTKLAQRAVANVLGSEADWLQEAWDNADTNPLVNGPEFRAGFATAIGWVRWHAEHPDLVIERLAER